jgi:phage terminase small subunit
MKLNPKQELFAQRVAGGETLTVAYRRAFPSSKAQPEIIYAMASRMAAYPQVAARIRELREKAADRLTISRENVLREAARIAFFDFRHLFNEDGTLKSIRQLDDDTAAVVSRVEFDDDGAMKKIFMHDKTANLEKLFKFLGLYEQDNRQKIDPLRELIESLSGKVVGVVDP